MAGFGSINLVAPEAEERLLSSCLGSPAALMVAVESGLRPEDFGGSTHEQIYRSMRDMQTRGQVVDITTLSSTLESGNKLDLIGGKGVLDRLLSLDQPSHTARDYSDIVRDRSLRRILFDATEEIVNRIHSEENVRELISGSENLIYRVADQLNGTGAMSGMTTAELVDLFKHRNKGIDRVPYPFETMQYEAKGRERGSLTVWGGYTGGGKTIVGMQSAVAAAKAGYNVGFFSLEMTEEELLYRMLSMFTGINKNEIEMGELDLEQHGLIGQSMHAITQLPIKTYHDPDLTPSDIRMIVQREDFDFVVVDYLQRFHFDDWKQLVEYTKQFKNMALSSGCAVDLLSQLKTASAEYGRNPFPYPDIMSMYGGRAIAHEANNVAFIYDHHVLDDNGQWVRNGEGEVVVVKQRGGKGEFKFPVAFDSQRIIWKEPQFENVFYLPGSNT